MTLTRRAALLGALALPTSARAAPPIRLGVLRFGTVAWELDVIRRHGLDAANGVAIEAKELASAQAAQVALQAGALDVGVQDWLWVARQRADGADWAFAADSTAIGAVIAPPGSPVRAIADLPGRRLGIAGSPLDKSWLILRAFASTAYGIDLDATVTKSFGPPPLLAEQAKAGRLDAVLTFWPFAARAEAAGAIRVFAMEDAVRGLGITLEVPVAGYVFAEHWARANPQAVAGVLAATGAARGVLAASDAEWTLVRPLMAASDDAEFAQLRAYYRAGIPRAAAADQARAAGRLFAVLAGIGGPSLVGSARTLPPGTFWQPS
jgi:NitT/TauT family transport system substrate-binding protein